jgi:hypothetical protein
MLILLLLVGLVAIPALVGGVHALRRDRGRRDEE